MAEGQIGPQISRRAAEGSSTGAGASANATKLPRLSPFRLHTRCAEPVHGGRNGRSARRCASGMEPERRQSLMGVASYHRSGHARRNDEHAHVSMIASNSRDNKESEAIPASRSTKAKPRGLARSACSRTPPANKAEGRCAERAWSRRLIGNASL